MATTNTAAANMDGAITDVEGVRLGHWTSRRRATGCTVVLTEAGAKLKAGDGNKDVAKVNGGRANGA